MSPWKMTAIRPALWDMYTARVERLLAERAEARARKDFSRADAAREAIASMGVEVRDTPAGPVWDIA